MESDGGKRIEVESILDRNAFELADQLLDASAELCAFEDFGPYTIREPIGRGGMGEVFLAEDKVGSRPVAIKFLRDLWSAAGVRELFTREIKTLAKLEHPFIARLYDAGIHPNGTPYFAMEYVEGEPIDEYCLKQECPLQERMRLFRAVCEAVQYAHSRLFVHRDLKPSNILVKEDGTPKLLDFGIAKQLESMDKPANQTEADVRFTRSFAAPEQLRREQIGVYTDVYSLGVILYELLAGKLPYDLENCSPGEAENIITAGPEPEKPSSVARQSSQLHATRSAWNDLDVLCLTAMQKDVGRRYASALELRQEVDRYTEGVPLKARADTLSYRIGKFVSRNRRPVLASALTLALVLVLIIFFTLRLARERDHANRETAIATAMNRFLLNDLLGRNDPFKTGASKQSFSQVVNESSPQIDVQFKEEPVLAAGLHLTIAKALDNRSDFAQARREYDRAFDLFRQAEGPLSQYGILTRLLRASMEARSFEAGSVALAQSMVTEAERSLAQIPHAREDLKVWLLSAHGVIAITGGAPRPAIDKFSEALRLAQAIPSFDPSALQQIKQRLAFSYIRLPDGAKAEALFRELLKDAPRNPNEDGPETLRLRTNLAQSFLIQGKYAEAIEEANLIYPALVSKLGEDHEFTIKLLSMRAAAEGYFGMWDQAARDDLAMYQLAVRKQGEMSFLSLGTLSDAAQSQCRAGHFNEGVANARKAYELSSKAFTQHAGITGGCAYTLAICLIGTNKLTEASDLLRNIDIPATTHQSGDSTVAASIALEEAEIAVRWGDYKLARSYADMAAPAFNRPEAEASQKLLLASIRSAIGSRHLSAK